MGAHPHFWPLEPAIVILADLTDLLTDVLISDCGRMAV